MIDGIRLKVCGLTSLVDAELADRCGADYLGFVLYPKSPRAITLERFRAMASRLPERRKVAVSVEPSADELSAMRDTGFDFFQIHFRPETGEPRLAEWSRIVGRDQLWLAPRLPPAVEVSPAVRSAAKHLVLDTFHAAGFGGSGQAGDWGKFARCQAAHPQNIWILAGGLNAGNIGTALAQSGARLVDVNSGVESAPGVKDETKLQRFVAALHQAVTGRP